MARARAVYVPRVPIAAEVAYTRRLRRRVVVPLRQVVLDVLGPAIDAYRAPDERADDERADDARADDLLHDFEALFRDMRVRYLRAVELDAEAQAAAESAADDVDRFNRLQQAKALRVIGLDVYVERGVHGHALRALRDRFVRDNVGLIRTIPERHFAQLEAWIKDGVQRGARHETLARELTQRLDAPASRAKLIARDQVSKHNSSLARERQQAVGLTHYRWSATLDARTRPDHFALHDTIQAWDKAPAIGHPGEPIQCRCVAIPVLDPPKTTST